MESGLSLLGKNSPWEFDSPSEWTLPGWPLITHRVLFCVHAFASCCQEHLAVAGETVCELVVSHDRVLVICPFLDNCSSESQHAVVKAFTLPLTKLPAHYQQFTCGAVRDRVYTSQG